MANQNFIPEDAPFSADQRSWLNNLVGKFISDLTSGVGLAGAAGPAVPATILWGSQTGNSEGLAKKLAKNLSKNGFTPKVVDMAAYDKADLSKEENVLLITSTYGDGEPPDNAADLYDWILSEDAPRLEQLNYTVLALGDSEYPDYCKCGIDFDERLAALGAKQITPRIDCDVDFDDEFAAWQKAIIASIGDSSSHESSVNAEDTGEDGYSKKHPFPASILRNENLNAVDSARETNHIEFSLEGSGLKYEAGDALGVYPENPEEVVDELIAALGMKPTEEVPLPGGGDGSLREALIKHYDIRSLNKKVIEQWQERSGAPFLRSIVEADSKEVYDEFCWGRELIDLAVDYPADFADAEEFVGSLKKLQPRLYSISSSPKAHPDEVHLTVAIVRYDSHYRSRGGVCSTFLADRAGDLKPGVFVHENKAFRVPEDGNKPIIMCGPGTGIAPFRAFLEERKATEAKGLNWLLFGNPHAATDFLYEEELNEMQKDGVLNKLSVAFSRDQKEKIYVQDRMLEEGAEIWKWLHDEGGSFYVCGDASRMAKDVDAALHQIAQTHGNMSEKEAEDFYKQMKKEKRYARDVY